MSILHACGSHPLRPCPRMVRTHTSETLLEGVFEAWILRCNTLSVQGHKSWPFRGLQGSIRIYIYNYIYIYKYIFGWLSKLWSLFGYPKYEVPYYNRDPKRDQNFDNHPYRCKVEGSKDSNIRPSGSKYHDNYVSWDVTPSYLSFWTLRDKVPLSGCSVRYVASAHVTRHS